MMESFYTYLHCKPNGIPFYVGKGFGKRAYEFGLSSRNKYHVNIVNKYGRENISIFVFECESESQALQDEIQQIAQLRREGYVLCNLTDGGQGLKGFAPSIETRIKLSEAGKGNKNGFGFKNHSMPHSEETKLKCAEANKGIRRSPATEFKKGMVGTNKGKTFSAEYRAKLSEAAKKKPPMSTETRAKISEKARNPSPELRAKFRELSAKRRNPVTGRFD